MAFTPIKKPAGLSSYERFPDFRFILSPPPLPPQFATSVRISWAFCRRSHKRFEEAEMLDDFRGSGIRGMARGYYA